MTSTEMNHEAQPSDFNLVLDIVDIISSTFSL